MTGTSILSRILVAQPLAIVAPSSLISLIASPIVLITQSTRDMPYGSIRYFCIVSLCSDSSSGLCLRLNENTGRTFAPWDSRARIRSSIN